MNSLQMRMKETKGQENNLRRVHNLIQGNNFRMEARAADIARPVRSENIHQLLFHALNLVPHVLAPLDAASDRRKIGKFGKDG